ncbi:hypothetical protein DFH09DRAFT_1081441 [Mycena vulgaris]|nr:hypothetical protein DFH09DRAFT_1081441 [Mycena vulgaris]
MHAVHAEVLLLPEISCENWISAIGSFLAHHGDIVQEKFGMISSQVAVIVGEIKHRNMTSRLNILGAWKFSSEEAHDFKKPESAHNDDNGSEKGNLARAHLSANIPNWEESLPVA